MRVKELEVVVVIAVERRKRRVERSLAIWGKKELRERLVREREGIGLFIEEFGS